MTDTPYTDDLISELSEIIRADHWWECDHFDSSGDCAGDRARAVLDALAAAGRLAPADDDPRHIIDIRPDGWTIKHPLACRPNLFECGVNRAAEQDLGQSDGPPVPPGRYEVDADEPYDRLQIFDRVNPTEG